ncbi:hypothetical protein HN51_052279 [Arachis hypogaea]
MSEKCRDFIHMGPEAVRKLCQKLRVIGRVKDSIRSTVEEQVAKFLHIIGHNVKTRIMSFFFHRSGETISRHFHNVLHDILSLEEELFKQPSGKYYLGDAGLMLKPGILTPYRGVQYHLKEYSVREPQNPKQLFNHRHSSLRNVIERCFRVLKKRFPIIADDTEPYYSFETMGDIFLACCIRHNFLMGVNVDKSIIDAVDRELLQEQNIDISQSNQPRDEEYRHVSLLRDNIAFEMWNPYQIF